jgi:hypothetical protein
VLIRHAVRGLLALAASVLLCAPAHAQLFRAYLSVSGSDSNPCTLPSPCRLLPAALNAVTSGGEIWLLDSANYNTATVDITKSVTILAVPGVVGSVVATGGDAIEVNTPGVQVVLRNLAIVPLPGTGGLNGISLLAGLSLTVENCIIANLTGNGIVVQPTTFTNLRVAGSTIRGNSDAGIDVVPGTASTTTIFDIIDTSIDANEGGGLVVSANNATSNVKGVIRNSRISQNGNNGIIAVSQLGSTVNVTVSHTQISHNSLNGIISTFGPTKVYAAGNTITDNAGTGLFAASSGVIESAGNNEVRNNGTNATGITTPGML